MSFTGDLAGPRIFSTASFSERPLTGVSSMRVTRSPDIMPARAAGVSSIGLTTLTSPFSIITSRPRPPNSSPFMLLWKSCNALGSK